MHVLALDTTTPDGSAALVDERSIIDERRGDPTRTHGERLPNEVLALVAAQGLTLADIDLFAVASGPGSFTGLRIGIATIQGLAVATRRPVVAVSALEALAMRASAGAGAGALAAAWMDAHRRDVFAALYRVTDAPIFTPERLVEIAPPSAAEPAVTLAQWTRMLADRPTLFVGDGAERYAAVVEEQGRRGWTVVPTRPLAGAIGWMALVRAARGDTIGPAAIQPLYVRRPDAEMDRDKKSGYHEGH